MENPFKFGTVVEGKYFTDRTDEQVYLAQILNSPNHAVLISPRRFGKSSLVKEVLNTQDREVISVNLQAITSVHKLAESLYRQFFATHPVEKAKHYFSKLRVAPTISYNPLTGSPEFSLQPTTDKKVVLEDVFSVLEKAGERKRLIVVLDEFPEILEIDKGLDKLLRSIMQEQKNINYILMGSQEDMMKKIFLRKKSPFYHFGSIIHLDKIPYSDFKQYIEDRLPVASRGCGLSDEILSFTDCHPYYTQQLAFQVWFILQQGTEADSSVRVAIEHIVRAHDFDYSRLWESMNRTNRLVLLKLSTEETAPFENPEIPTSTIYSALKRLVSVGILIKNGKYNYDDPFFKLWVKRLN